MWESDSAFLTLFLSLLFYNEDSGIFGVPLTVLLENDRRKDSGVKVPLVLQKVSTVYITGKFIELCACSMLFINPLMNILRFKDTKAPLGCWLWWLSASLLASTWHPRHLGVFALPRTSKVLHCPARKHQVIDTDVVTWLPSVTFLPIFFKCYLRVCMCFCVHMWLFSPG